MAMLHIVTLGLSNTRSRFGFISTAHSPVTQMDGQEVRPNHYPDADASRATRFSFTVDDSVILDASNEARVYRLMVEALLHRG